MPRFPAHPNPESLAGGDGKVCRRATQFLINGQKRKQRKEETVETAKFAFGFIYLFFFQMGKPWQQQKTKAGILF